MFGFLKDAGRGAVIAAAVNQADQHIRAIGTVVDIGERRAHGFFRCAVNAIGDQHDLTSAQPCASQ